jgi:hypothetical protein
MLESVLVGAGLALVLAGALSFIYPLRWLGIPTRGIAMLVTAGGFLVVAIGTGMIDSYFVYLGFTLFFAGLHSLIRPLRFLYIRTRSMALMVSALGLARGAGDFAPALSQPGSGQPRH